MINYEYSIHKNKKLTFDVEFTLGQFLRTGIKDPTNFVLVPSLSNWVDSDLNT